MSDLAYYYSLGDKAFVLFNEDVVAAVLDDQKVLAADLMTLEPLSTEKLSKLFDLPIVEHNPLFNGKLLQYALDILISIEPSLRHTVLSSRIEAYKAVAGPGSVLKKLKDVGKGVKDAIKQDWKENSNEKGKLNDLIQLLKKADGGDEYAKKISEMMANKKLSPDGLNALTSLLEKNPNWIKIIDLDAESQKNSAKLKAMLTKTDSSGNKVLPNKTALDWGVNKIIAHLQEKIKTLTGLSPEEASVTVVGKQSLAGERTVVFAGSPEHVAQVMDALGLAVDEVGNYSGQAGNPKYSNDIALKLVADSFYFDMPSKELEPTLVDYIKKFDKGFNGDVVITETGKGENGERDVVIEYQHVKEVVQYLKTNKMVPSDKDKQTNEEHQVVSLKEIADPSYFGMESDTLDGELTIHLNSLSKKYKETKFHIQSVKESKTPDNREVIVIDPDAKKIIELLKANKMVADTGQKEKEAEIAKKVYEAMKKVPQEDQEFDYKSDLVALEEFLTKPNPEPGDLDVPTFEEIKKMAIRYGVA